PVPPIRRALAAPKAATGPTPAEMLMAQYKQRKNAGLV
ncbi:phage replication protein, partial [Citrobacter sp. wls715]